MQLRSWSDARIAIAVGTSMVAVAVWWFARTHWDSVYDDAFIYLRYVRNLDNGCGLRFNCNDAPVEGFTSPLYLALLWLGSLVTTRLIELCQWVGAIAVVVAGAFAIATATVLGARNQALPHWMPALLALLTAVVLALDDFVLLNANIGLETSLAAMTCSLLGYAVITERPRLVAFAAVAAMLARPEAVLFVIALPVLPWIRRARYLVPVAVAVIAVVVARLVIFEALAPNTYYAKSGGTWRHLQLGALYTLTLFRDFPLTLLAPLCLLGRPRWALYFLGVALAWLLFFLRSGGDTFAYSRLWFPLVPTLTAMSLGGLTAWLARRADRRIAIAVPVALALAVAGRAAVVHSIPEQHANPRVVEWIAVGSYLRANVPRGSLVATVPIGAIGYYSSLPILDLVGLTDATIARAGRTVPTELLTQKWIGHERHDTEYVLARAPQLIVTTMVRDRAWSLEEARAGFWADWLLLQEIKHGAAPYVVRDAEVMPGRHVLMFARATPTPAP